MWKYPVYSRMMRACEPSQAQLCVKSSLDDGLGSSLSSLRLVRTAGLIGADLGGTGGASDETEEIDEYGEAPSRVASCGAGAVGTGEGLRYPLHIQESLEPTLLVAEGGTDSTSALIRCA